MEARRRTQILTRTAAADDAALLRLVERKDRLAALLRASRRVPAPPPVTYRSAYAKSLWESAAVTVRVNPRERSANTGLRLLQGARGT